VANIYEDKKEDLHVLLERAGGKDATVLIPDLQRPYVWSPLQVSLLVDSLIRGWPFGTLLMWKVAKDALSSIPHRPFWYVADRTGSAAAPMATPTNPPAEFHMVLDGQQRVQSLLLALGGDSWGFKLENRDWAELLQEKRKRGRAPKYPHWSKASLCFDLLTFQQQYKGAHDNVLAVDYQQVLWWAVTDPVKGRSTWAKTNNYVEPLICTADAQHHGRFIRLSRLWEAARPDPNLREKNFRQAAEDVLRKEGLDQPAIDPMLNALGELLGTFRDIKLAKITYLELRSFDSTLWSEDDYNEAIVSVFTRLNTAGRTLTRQEITLAWIKVGWDDSATGLPATACFETLLDLLKREGIELDIDELVTTVSFAWSVTHADGKLLATRDLLRGGIIRPMALALSADWPVLCRAIELGMQTAKRRGLMVGRMGVGASVSAMTVVWAWLHLALRWQADNRATVLNADAFTKRVVSCLNEYLDRWIVCSQWAGLWENSTRSLERLALVLAAASIGLKKAATADQAIDALRETLRELVGTTEQTALFHLHTFSAVSRDRFGGYYSLLWIWHRLDAERWEMSQISLRTDQGSVHTEVDHCVAFDVWQERLTKELQPNDPERYQLAARINQLGNAALLEKSFNASRGRDTLSSFLAKVHEFKSGEVRVADWAATMHLTDPFLEPDKFSLAQITAAIEARDVAMQQDLERFVKGDLTRKDL